jgi:hypothetical protein
MSCSARKVSSPGLLAATYRYDGSAFRVLRKYLREVPDPDLSVYILSAKFGLISCKRRIPHYDCKMNKQRAIVLRRSLISKLKSILRYRRYQRAFFIGGRTYLTAIEPLHQFRPVFRIAKGEQGQKLKSLRAWLRH